MLMITMHMYQKILLPEGSHMITWCIHTMKMLMEIYEVQMQQHDFHNGVSILVISSLGSRKIGIHPF